MLCKHCIKTIKALFTSKGLIAEECLMTLLKQNMLREKRKKEKEKMYKEMPIR